MNDRSTVPTLHKERTTVPVETLRLLHRNARQGDVGAISQSITRNGLYKDLVVNRGTLTGRPMEVLTGNHTLVAAREKGVALIDVTILDLDEDDARSIALADNHSSDLASYDDRTLLEMLREQNASPGGLEGTTYDGDDIDDIMDRLAGSLDREDANPPDDPEPHRDQHVVTVICENEDHQREVYESLRAEGYTVKAVTA